MAVLVEGEVSWDIVEELVTVFTSRIESAGSDGEAFKAITYQYNDCRGTQYGSRCGVEAVP